MTQAVIHNKQFLLNGKQQQEHYLRHRDFEAEVN